MQATVRRCHLAVKRPSLTSAPGRPLSITGQIAHRPIPASTAGLYLGSECIVAKPEVIRPSAGYFRIAVYSRTVQDGNSNQQIFPASKQ